MLTGEDVSKLDLHLENKDISHTMGNLCVKYQAIRPVLVVLKKIIFFKPKWQNAVEVLISALDEACPVT